MTGLSDFARDARRHRHPISLTDLHDDLSHLIRATASGDRGAFKTLYGRSASKLLPIVLRIVKDREIAEDVVQEAYLRIWRGAASFTPDAGRPMTWMISIARHRAIDVVRSGRDARALISSDDPDAMSDIVDPRDNEAEIVERDRLRVCLGRLDPTHRDCFVAAYGEGLSREELASRYGRPVNTIKTWLHRSANLLRTCLDEA